MTFYQPEKRAGSVTKVRYRQLSVWYLHLMIYRPVPTSASLNGADPFELERLAEELEIRELHDADTTHAEFSLPIAHLTHDDPHLTGDSFSVEEFLLSRPYTSLPDLRSELRDYQGILKQELVGLINDDYEAFISLSTNLQGEDLRIKRLQRPLDSLREVVMVSRPVTTFQSLLYA